MRWRPWRRPKRPSIRRPPLPGLKKPCAGFRGLYDLEGGPFEGMRMRLSDGNSAIFTLPRNKYGASVRGRYECAVPTRREGIVGVAHWRPR